MQTVGSRSRIAAALLTGNTVLQSSGNTATVVFWDSLIYLKPHKIQT